MTSNRPYLVRAINEWILDNDMTPHLLVDASKADVVVPRQFVQDGRIVLNISPSSVRGLLIDDQAVSFGARFSGSHFDVFVPMAAVQAVYARENGKGLVLPEEESDEPPPGDARDESSETAPSESTSRKSPNLRIVR
jgi:stringent starvation protein B